MVVLIDTNVIIDFLIMREPFFEASSNVIRKCAEGELKGYVAFHSIPNLWYILRKLPEDKRRKWILDLLEFLRVAGAGHDEVLRAVKMTEFRDLEDCLQDRCAKNIAADYIITRNVEDFDKSEVPAISPEDFLVAVSHS